MTRAATRVLSLVLGLAASVASAAPGSIPLEFERTPLADIVSEIARATGTSILFDDQLKGNLTLAAPQRATPEEALALLDSALLMMGFAAIPIAHGVRRVMPITEAHASAPWRTEGAALGADRPVATLLPLEFARADEVAAKLGHLVSRQDVLVPYLPTNSLILVGSEARLRRLMELALLIDRGELVEIAIHSARYRDASEILEMASAIFALGEGFDLWADERTNRVIARGTPEVLSELAAFIDKIDRPAVGGGAIEVVPLLHREPAEIATLLESLARGGAPAEATARLAAAQSLAGRVFVVAAEPRTSSLLVQADRETRALIRDVVRDLDLPPRQVLVEMAVIEVSKPRSLAFGFDFFVPLTNPMNAADTIATLFSNPSGGGIRGRAGDDIGFFGRVAQEPLVVSVVDPESGNPINVVIPRSQATITATDRSLTTELRARPHLVVMAGEEHELVVGDNIPVPVSQGSSANAGIVGLTTQQTIERHDTGLTMRVRPTLGQEGGIQLDLRIELSQVTDSLAGDVARVGPTLSSQTIEATIQLRAGQLAILGVGRDEVEAESETGVPYLRSIPVFGWLFRTQRLEIRDRQLLVTVEARVLDDPVASMAEDLRLRLAFARERARAPRLPAPAEHAYALRIGGARSQREADLRAADLRALGFEPQITRWSWEAQDYFDVYLGSYGSITELGRARRRAEQSGLRSELVLSDSLDRSADGGGWGDSVAASLGRSRPE